MLKATHKVIPIKGDNNCGWRSVAYVVDGDQQLWPELKRRFIEHVRAILIAKDSKLYTYMQT